MPDAIIAITLAIMVLLYAKMGITMTKLVIHNIDFLRKENDPGFHKFGVFNYLRQAQRLHGGAGKFVYLTLFYVPGGPVVAYLYGLYAWSRNRRNEAGSKA